MQDPDAAEVIFQVVRDGAVYGLNGFLVVVYALIAHWALVLAVFCALGVLVLDRLVVVQTRLAARDGTPTSKRDARITLVVLALWIVVALSVPMPVPALGLGIWLTTLLAGWLIPSRRGDVLWRGKMSLLMYALANAGLLLFMRLTADLSSGEWAALLGGSGNANAAIANSQGLVQMVATIAIWYLMPLAAIGWQLKEFAVNRGSVVAANRTAGQIFHAIRTRAGEIE